SPSMFSRKSSMKRVASPSHGGSAGGSPSSTARKTPGAKGSLNRGSTRSLFIQWILAAATISTLRGLSSASSVRADNPRRLGLAPCGQRTGDVQHLWGRVDCIRSIDLIDQPADNFARTASGIKQKSRLASQQTRQDVVDFA